MRNRKRFSILALISAVVFSLVVIGSPARAATVSFEQISWGDGVGGFEDQYSPWGQASVSFSPGDIGSFGSFGSGYLGWVNIVTTVSGGLNNNWAVENEPVIFDSPSDLGGDLPLTLNFNLGQTDGTAVGGLNYSLSITAAPLTLQPSGPLSFTAVGAASEVEGTEGDPDSEGDEAGSTPQNSVGVGAAVAGGAAAALTGRGTIQTPTTNVPSVNEARNGCAPGAAARSIRYLGNMIPSLNVTQNAQQIYGTLTNLMQSSTGPGNTTGTKINNFISGKNLYFTTNNLSIAPTVVTTNFGAAISALNSTGDVELGVSWGYRLSNTVSGVVTNYLGGHAVFVTGITTLYTNGIPYRYLVDVIQDPAQGTGSVTNETDRYSFDTNGNLLNRGNNGRINSFRIETATIPEPETVEMAGLGIGALALLHALRRRRRRT